MKLPHASATATALTILAATIALPAPARAQTYDPSYPVYADLSEHRGFLLRVPLPNDGAVCRVGLGPLRAMRGQSILRRAESRAQQAPKAASAVLKSARFKGLAFRRPRTRHSPAVTAERERPRWGLGGSRRVRLQAAPGCFDLSVARPFASGPLLGGGRTVLRHVVAHDRTRNSTQDTGFTRNSSAWYSKTQRQHTYPT